MRIQASPWNDPDVTVQWLVTVKPAAPPAKSTDWNWTAQAPGYASLSGTAATREAAKQAVAKATQAATSPDSESYVLSYRAPVPTAVVSP